MRFSESTHLLVYVFGDFNVHHKDWLTLIGGTEGMLSSVIIYLNLNDLRWLNFLRVTLIVILTALLLDLFISSDYSICSTIAFPSLGNSDHVVVSVSIGFPSNSKKGTPFHCTDYDYSH